MVLTHKKVLSKNKDCSHIRNIQSDSNLKTPSSRILFIFLFHSNSFSYFSFDVCLCMCDFYHFLSSFFHSFIHSRLIGRLDATDFIHIETFPIEWNEPHPRSCNICPREVKEEKSKELFVEIEEKESNNDDQPSLQVMCPRKEYEEKEEMEKDDKNQ